MRKFLRSIAYGTLHMCTLGRGVRRVICGEPIRIPARWCRYYPADYEPATFEFLRAHCRPSDTVMDIGAHIGLFSVLMARQVGQTGHVFSFEPTSFTRKVLEETVRLNGCTDIVEIRREAITGSTGAMIFYDTGDMISNANSLALTERSKSSVIVDTVSIDDFVLTRGLSIHCMKIDVEGAELDALRGAKRVLRLCRPFVYLALHPNPLRQAGGSLAEVWDAISEYGAIVIHHGLQMDPRSFCDQTDNFDVQLVPGRDAQAVQKILAGSP